MKRSFKNNESELIPVVDNKSNSNEDIYITDLDVENVIESTSKSNFTSDFGKFLLNLRIKHNVTESCTEFIVHKFKEIIEEKMNESQKISKKCTDINDLYGPFNDILDGLEELNSVYLQNKHFEKYPFVKPVEIQIGSSKDEVMVYVPIHETLKVLLSHDDVLSHVFHENQDEPNYDK